MCIRDSLYPELNDGVREWTEALRFKWTGIPRDRPGKNGQDSVHFRSISVRFRTPGPLPSFNRQSPARLLNNLPSTSFGIPCAIDSGKPCRSDGRYPSDSAPGSAPCPPPALEIARLYPCLLYTSPSLFEFATTRDGHDPCCPNATYRTG